MDQLRVFTGLTASFGDLAQDAGDHGNEAVIRVGALSMVMTWSAGIGASAQTAGRAVK
jgi:hypothetical protein